MSEASILVGEGARDDANEPAAIASARLLSVKPIRYSVLCILPEIALRDRVGAVPVGIGADLCWSLANLLVSSDMELCGLSTDDRWVDFVEVASNEPPIVDLSGDKDSVVENGKYSPVSILGLTGRTCCCAYFAAARAAAAPASLPVDGSCSTCAGSFFGR